MIAEAGSPDISRKVGVIGWYCSKTRDDVSLSPSDRSLFDELLPGPWQVALIVRPNVVDAMRAAFFFRDHKGTVAKGLECYETSSLHNHKRTNPVIPFPAIWAVFRHNRLSIVATQRAFKLHQENGPRFIERSTNALRPLRCLK